MINESRHVCIMNRAIILSYNSKLIKFDKNECIYNHRFVIQNKQIYFKKKFSMSVEHSMNISITLILYKSEQCITRQRFFNNEENQFFNTLRAK